MRIFLLQNQVKEMDKGDYTEWEDEYVQYIGTLSINFDILKNYNQIRGIF